MVLAYYGSVYAWSTLSAEKIHASGLRSASASQQKPLLLTSLLATTRVVWLDNETYPADIGTLLYHSVPPSHVTEEHAEWAKLSLDQVSAPCVLLSISAHVYFILSLEDISGM